MPTKVGMWRKKYGKEVEAAPSRFAGDERYTEWAKKADAWAKKQPGYDNPNEPKARKKKVVDKWFN